MLKFYLPEVGRLYLSALLDMRSSHSCAIHDALEAGFLATPPQNAVNRLTMRLLKFLEDHISTLIDL